MNKQAAQIATIVRSIGVTPLQAALLVKAAQDKAVSGRMEKNARAWLARQGAKVFGGGAAKMPAPHMPTPPPPAAAAPGRRSVSEAYDAAMASPKVRGPYTPPATPAGPAPTPIPGRGVYAPPPAPTMPGGAPGAPPPAPGMSFGRKAGLTLGGGAGVGGAGAVGYGHIQNYRQNSGPEENVFQHNMGQFDEQSKGIKGDMDAALASGDTQKFNALQEKFQKGDFGGSPFSLGGLNPFASRTGAHYQQNALAAQKGLQGKYNAAMAKSGPQAGDAELAQQLQQRMQSGDILPQHAQMMQKQLDQVKARMAQKPGTSNPEADAIKARMEGAKMRWMPGTPPGAAPGAAPASPQPYQGWNTRGRGVPNTAGYGAIPEDGRSKSDIAWGDVVGRPAFGS